MPVLKCKMCGGDLNVTDDSGVVVCEYCGTKQTISRTNDDVINNLYNRANNLRLKNEFDKAQNVYEKIIEQDADDAEAYWSLVLCKYGIEYVEDPLSHKRVPTVNRTQYTSIFADHDYKEAISRANPEQKIVYEQEAQAIDKIQKGILEISKKEEPFDIFICYKETDEKGHRTIDSVIANDLYHELVNEGYKVFFSKITLEDKLGEAYEPYIFAALNSAKVMVVLGTKADYFNAVWVKNEWSRYLQLIAKGEKKTLIPAYRDMDPYDLPEEFAYLQALDMSKIGFVQDLLRGIRKLVATEEKNDTREIIVENHNANAEPLLKRAFIFLEDGNFQSADEYCDKVLDIDPENGKAYLGKLMVQQKMNTVSALLENYEHLYGDPDYERTSISEVMDDYQDIIASKVEEYTIPSYLEEDKLKELFRKYNTSYDSKVPGLEKQKEMIINLFNDDRSISKIRRYGNQDITSLFDKVIESYDKRIEEAKDNDKETIALIKQGVVDFMNETEDSIKNLYDEESKKREEDYEKAVEDYEKTNLIDVLKQNIEVFTKCGDYRDSKEYIERCNVKIAELKEQHKREEEAAAKKKQKTILLTVAAVILSIIAFVFYQNVILPNNKYNQAHMYVENGEYEQAVAIYKELGEYRDCQELYKDAFYKQGQDALQKENYETAIAVFTELGTYEASGENLKQAIYGYALSLVEKLNYDEALEEFDLINEYKDVADKILDTKYHKAQYLYEQKKYDDAIALFTEIVDYEDSNNFILKVKYDKALWLLENKNYDESIALFDEISGFEDAAKQKKEAEKEKDKNTVKIPSVLDKSQEKAESLLKEADLKYTVKTDTSQNQVPGTVIKVSPDQGTRVMKGSTVTITVAKGSSQYSTYAGDNNNNVLYQVNVSGGVSDLKIRSAPTAMDNNILDKAKTGQIFNVYETLSNEGYTWLRIGNKRWIADNGSWVYRDTKCDNRNGNFTFVTATISDPDNDHVSLYDNPVGNENMRNWVGSVYNGETVKVYFRFHDGTYWWYKVGVDRWIKDSGEGRVKIN
ncbi:MAG: TIR domain-containing protein [Erysipelotrichaceae bacterium]|nr:TIR domain-containing protein [Erysipelotrichaceae bacterium]